MELLTPQQREQLLENGRRAALEVDFDPVPVVKLFTPDASATWLLTELFPDTPDIAWGLCDLGLGVPEIGSVSLAELIGYRGNLGLHVERDIHVTLDKPLSVYAKAAREAGRITL